MPKTKTKTDYSITYRTRLKNGQWGEWKNKAEGLWQGLEVMQNQIKILIRANPRAIQIKVEKDGHLIDYMGNKTDKPIEYEKSR